MNSKKPRLLRKFPLIQGEDPEEFYKFQEKHWADLRPEGALQEYFADRWIKDAWWLDRFDSIVAAFLDGSESLDDLSLSEVFEHIKFITGETGRRLGKIPEIFNFLKQANRSEGNTRITTPNKPEVGSTEESRLTHTMEFLRESSELSASQLALVKHLNGRLRKASRKTPGEADEGAGERAALSTETTMETMAQAYSRNREALKLAFCFRAKIERSRNNSLHELQRLQAARQGQMVRAPEVLDVNVNFDAKSAEKNYTKVAKRSRHLPAADRRLASKRH